MHRIAWHLQQSTTHLEASCPLLRVLDCNMPVKVVIVEAAARCVALDESTLLLHNC